VPIGSAGFHPPAGAPRPVTSFVHQRSRFTEGQRHAWERYWSRYGHDVRDLVADPARFDPRMWFGRTAPLVLEIGSGMGESTAQTAAAAAEVDHLAVEVFEPGLAQLLMRIETAGLTNLRLLRGDAVELLKAVLVPDTLAEIRIFFPDPWPKRRHRKRRLVQPEVVRLLASRLQPGGMLHLATDWADYATQMRQVCDAEPALENTAADQPGGWTPRPPTRPVTKFEARANAEGRVVRDLVYRRRREGAPTGHPQ
jgi:tRNA (guanine-N7-)-methyltransferase